MSKLKKVLIMAGGTGGHVYPGLAVAQYFQEKGILVEWLGTSKGLEAQIVPKAGFPLHFVTISGLRKKGWKDLFLAPFRLIYSIKQAITIIRSFEPDVVIGMGGFVSGPGGIASLLLRKKLVIHEQNAKPGLTNQYLATIAAKVLEGFPNTFLKRTKVVTTGNPVRQEIASLLPPAKRLPDRQPPPHLFVFGGSLGAEALNRLLPGALAKLSPETMPAVLHQAGEKNVATTAAAYKAAGIEAEVVPFITKMDEAYAWADMVLCRAGALTIAELCAAGCGAILIPYPYAVDDHQTANANFMVQKNAALLVQQAALTQDLLADMLKELCASSNKRLAMAEAAYALRQVDATEKVFQVCKEICH